MSDDQADNVRVQNDLQKAKAAWSSGIGRRDKIYGYLKAVFEIGQSWKREGRGVRYQSLMREIANVNLGERQPGRFRVIVYCSSNPKTKSDFKVRNKWVQWLEVASEEIEEGQTFKDFVKERGGSISAAPLR